MQEKVWRKTLKLLKVPYSATLTSDLPHVAAAAIKLRRRLLSLPTPIMISSFEWKPQSPVTTATVCLFPPLHPIIKVSQCSCASLQRTPALSFFVRRWLICILYLKRQSPVGLCHVQSRRANVVKFSSCFFCCPLSASISYISPFMPRPLGGACRRRRDSS